MYLNLGCGDPFAHAPAPWVNIDVRPPSRPDLFADVLHLPFGDASADLIYAGHLLEHLEPEDVPVAMRELSRVLVQGGEVLFVGPDWDKTLALEAQGLMAPERKASNGAHPDEHEDPGAHSWASSAALVLPMARAAHFAARELPIRRTPERFPVFDRVTPDQYAVLARKVVA